MAIQLGEHAPDFSLPSATGTSVSLADFRGKRTVVLFFYPKDESPGCTAEACAFRDANGEFAEAGAEVLGVSSDSAKSHQKFADKHKLPMTLLSDESGEVQTKYGVRSLFGLLPGRVTFVIDRGGIIRYVFDSQLRFNRHVEEALRVVRSLESGQASTG
ncbi:MAG: peroxiredoxin [Myxococcales bacterium]